MAVFSIGSANSVFNAAGVAFQSDSATADTLRVLADGFLISGGAFNAVRLKNTLAWNVQIEGSVASLSKTGMVLDAGNSAASLLTILGTGYVYGDLIGIDAGSAATVTNRGVVAGDTAIILRAASSRLTNYGEIIGNVQSLSATTIVNSGDIDGAIALGSGNDVVTNDGHMLSANFGNGANRFTNNGRIGGDEAEVFLRFGSGADTIVNSGEIRGLISFFESSALSLGDGINTVTNTSTGIVSVRGLNGGNLRDLIVNAGNFTASRTNLGGGDDELRNTGVFNGGRDIVFGIGNNVLTNSGKFSVSDVFFDAGNDTVTNSGLLDAKLSFSSGNNKLTNSGTIVFNSGSFSVNFGAGTDTVLNSGLIQSETLDPSNEIDLGDGTNTFTNSLAGQVFLGLISGGVGGDTFTNGGTVTVGDVNLGGGADKFDNTKSFTGRALLGEGADRFSNTALFAGDVIMGLGADTFVNSGALTGNVDMTDGVSQIDIVVDRVTNSGRIVGTVAFGGGNDIMTNSGDAESVSFGNGNNQLNNSGRMGVTFQDIFITFGNGNDTVVNSGIIQDPSRLGVNSQITLGDGVNSVTNNATGTISVATIAGGNSRDTIVNKGRFFGNAFLGGSIDQITNDGTYSGEADLGDDADTFVNTASYTGKIFMGNGGDTFNNSGAIAGDVNMTAGTGRVGFEDVVERFTNTGTITGSVVLGLGNDIAVNRGTINGGVVMNDGLNQFTNSGRITGDVIGAQANFLGGTTIFTNYAVINSVKVSGIVLGEIFLSPNNDRFNGGDRAETVRDSGGEDLYFLAGGDDAYESAFDFRGTPDAVDTVDGGAGSDTFSIDHLGLAQTTIVNLDTIGHSFGAGFLNPGGGAAGANQVLWNGVLTERVLNFENVNGTPYTDIVHGNSSANRFIGDAGDDSLFGYAGTDTLDGGDGIDNLVGGLGRDILTGGTDQDYFILNSASESPFGAGRDSIMDFSQADGDQISLDGFDAITVNGAGIDEFTAFIGTNIAFAPNAPGTLRAVFTAAGWLIEGNTDNDVAPEFQIEVRDTAHTIMWSLADFFL